MIRKQMGHWFLPVAAWIGVIFLSSTAFAGEWCTETFHSFSTKLLGQVLNHSSLVTLSFLAEKSVHVALFLILGTLLWKAVKAIEDVPKKIAVILLLGLLIGAASEFLQRFFPGRDPSVRDVAINLCSTAIGVALSFKFARIRQNKFLTAESEA